MEFDPLQIKFVQLIIKFIKWLRKLFSINISLYTGSYETTLILCNGSKYRFHINWFSENYPVLEISSKTSYTFTFIKMNRFQ